MPCRIKHFIGRYELRKIFLFPVFLLLSTFYFPYLYFFYRRKLNNVSPQVQLFFQTRQEYGAILELLYYSYCWTNVRNGGALVVFDRQFALTKRLAKLICPTVQIICPRVL